jgi:hypothetical protein
MFVFATALALFALVVSPPWVVGVIAGAAWWIAAPQKKLGQCERLMNSLELRLTS